MVQIWSYAEIYEMAKAYMIANQTKITDFNENQGLDTQIKAFSTILNGAMVKVAGGFKLQFEDIPYQVFQFPRIQSTFASTTVVFTRELPYTGVKTIEAGTVVGTSAGLYYVTQAVATINDGAASSGAVEAIADTAGSDYNVPVGIVTVLVSSVEGVNVVTNNIAASGGRDKESNSEYYRRFYNFILGLSKSNLYGILTTATQTSGVQSVSIYEHFPPQSGIYNFTCYVDNGAGSTPAELLAEVYLRLKGDGTVDYPGAASPGINFRCLSASVVPVDVDVTIDLDPVRGDRTIAEAAITAAIQNYINHLWVGFDCLPARLSAILMSITHVYNVDELLLNDAAIPILISDNQVARVNIITVTFSESHPR
jgi:uncharacterized phage protein gp47/JayE